MCHMSCVRCHVSGVNVTCQVSHVTYMLKYIYYKLLFFFKQRGGASRWRVRYQGRRLPRLDY